MVVLADPDVGSYVTRVKGRESGEYELDTIVTDVSNVLSHEAFGGILRKGETVEYISRITNSSERMSTLPKNRAPTLRGIGDRTVKPGVPIDLVASGTDPDAGQRLTYRLVPGTALGARIDESSGRISWTPTRPGKYTFTVSASDDGAPSLSDSETFAVTVGDYPPSINVGPAARITRGVSFSRIGSFATKAPGPYVVTVDYGDGSGPRRLAVSRAKTFDLNHTYERSGAYRILVTVRDGTGGFGSKTLSVNVASAPISSGFGAGLDAFVATLYREVLGRRPDPSGLSFWSATLAGGKSFRSVASAFWLSSERRILSKLQNAPPITFGQALRDGIGAWKVATTVGVVHPTGNLGVKSIRWAVRE